MKTKKLLSLLVLILPQVLMAQDLVTINSNITTDTEWTSDNEYLLDGIIFVTDGAELTIEAGTTVRGAFGQNLDASALVITRGSKIFAEGTAENPIIFTAENDENLTKDDVGLWAGLVILGRATTNNAVEATIEGVNEISNDPALVGYGGGDDMDNSGVLRYVSIRHTGINIGSSSGNEIQGLTLGAVGAGTTIEYIESFASGDDGYEFFGGTVNTRYLVSAFNNDDAFDWDQGYRGKNQFWFAILDSDQTGRAAEMDGAGGDETGTPFAYPVIANATFIGPGENAEPSGDTGQLLQFRDNTGGLYANSIFVDHLGDAVNVEDIEGVNDFDSRARLEADSLKIVKSMFHAFGSGDKFEGISSASFVAEMLSANQNEVQNPLLKGISRAEGSKELNPMLQDNSPALNFAAELQDEWLEATEYAGAFGANNWLAGWTALDAHGFLSDDMGTSNRPVRSEMPESIQLYQNYPNPFNPSTKITFSLPVSQAITLKVYDMVGREVAILADGRRFSSGLHSLNFDAANLSSGMYIYKISSGNFSHTRKMTLIK